MIEQRLELCFKGDRDYLHGTDMYAAITDAAAVQGVRIGSHRLGIHAFARTQCALKMSAAGEPLASPERVVADFRFESPGGTVTGFLTETGAPVACRYAFDEDAIGAEHDAGHARIIASGTLNYAPIEILVALTKKLHNATLPDPSGKWVFTRLELARALDAADANRMEIALQHNFNQRLTKSQVTAGGTSVGHVYFSLWRP